MNVKKEVFIRSAKIFNIGWATVAYFFIALVVLFILEKIYGRFDEKKYEKMSTQEIVIELIVYLWVIGIATYIVRNLFTLVPFPLDGIMGYDHKRVKEVTNAAVFGIFIVALNPRIQGYYTLLRTRLSKYL